MALIVFLILSQYCIQASRVVETRLRLQTNFVRQGFDDWMCVERLTFVNMKKSATAATIHPMAMRMITKPMK